MVFVQEFVAAAHLFGIDIGSLLVDIHGQTLLSCLNAFVILYLKTPASVLSANDTPDNRMRMYTSIYDWHFHDSGSQAIYARRKPQDEILLETIRSARSIHSDMRYKISIARLLMFLALPLRAIAGDGLRRDHYHVIVRGIVRGHLAKRTSARWALLRAVSKILYLHTKAVVTANHPVRKLARGEFDDVVDTNQ